MSGNTKTATIRVLVVDDEESIRSFAEEALKIAGYQATTAASGAEALSIVEKQGGFDLYIIDVLMPQMTGDELARQIRLGNPDARILYFTGYVDKLFEERNTLWQNEAFIEKPVTLNALLEAVSLNLFGHTRGLDPA